MFKWKLSRKRTFQNKIRILSSPKFFRMLRQYIHFVDLSCTKYIINLLKYASISDYRSRKDRVAYTRGVSRRLAPGGLSWSLFWNPWSKVECHPSLHVDWQLYIFYLLSFFFHFFFLFPFLSPFLFLLFWRPFSDPGEPRPPTPPRYVPVHITFPLSKCQQVFGISFISYCLVK